MNITNETDLKIVLQAFLKFLLLAIVMLVVPAAVYMDVVFMGHGMPEASVTEYLQETLLLLSAIGFFMLAHSRRNIRGFAILVGGFLGTMLIRELDGVFDKITHGFWVYPAMAWVGLTLVLAARFRDGLLAAMVAATRSRSFVYIVIGLAVVLAFSRVFGTSSLWKVVLDGGASVALVKNTVQEGLELLGYLLIFSGTVSYYREVRLQTASTRFRRSTSRPAETVRRRPSRSVRSSKEKRNIA